MKKLWLDKLKTILETKPKSEEELFLDILAMLIYSRYNDDLSLVYKQLGLDEFISLVNHVSGKTIEFPTQEDLKDSVMTALCYYYKEVKGMEWDEIHHKLPYDDINSIKYGKRISRLNRDMKKEMEVMFQEIDKQGGNVDGYRKYSRWD